MRMYSVYYMSTAETCRAVYRHVINWIQSHLVGQLFNFITAFTSVRHLSLSWATSIQSMPHPPPPHNTTWSSIFILSSFRNPDLQTGHFSSDFPPKPCTHLYSPAHLLPALQSHSSLFEHRKIYGKEYRSLSSSFCSFLHSPLPRPPWPKHCPQHTILTQHHPAFLPQREWPSSATIQNNRQNYIFCIF